MLTLYKNVFKLNIQISDTILSFGLVVYFKRMRNAVYKVSKNTNIYKSEGDLPPKARSKVALASVLFYAFKTLYSIGKHCCVP